MAPTVSQDNWITVDASLRIGVQRTLRVPNDGGDYPLPPALGRLLVRLAADYPTCVPQAWQGGLHFLIAIHLQDAAWLQFNARHTDPRALAISAGAVNALTGHPWHAAIEASPQNYVVVPHQPWLDGFTVQSGVVRQFVAVPLRGGGSVEEQVTGETEGGITIAVFEPKAGALEGESSPPRASARARDLGLGAGGRITQRVYPDPYGADVWSSTPAVVIHLHLIEAEEFARLTGERVPLSPVDTETHTGHGLPWFELYDSARGELPATPELSGVKSLDEVENEPQNGARPQNVRPIPPRSRRKR